jgi:hypothetical protein
MVICTPLWNAVLVDLNATVYVREYWGIATIPYVPKLRYHFLLRDETTIYQLCEW